MPTAAALPPGFPDPNAFMAKLFAWLNYANGEHWKQRDLLTGKPVNTCAINLSDYIGSDGHIVLTDNDAGMMIATDMSSCRALWRIPIRQYIIEQVGTAFIRETRETRDEIVAFKPA